MRHMGGVVKCKIVAVMGETQTVLKCFVKAVFHIHTSACNLQMVQVVVEVSYVKNPQFFVVELASISKLSKTSNDSASLSRKTISFMGWKSYL